MSEHKIEQTVGVYLVWRGGEWVVDPVTVDGAPLDAAGNRAARNEACPCGDPQGCARVREVADHAPLPTGQELARKLALTVRQHGD